MPVVPRVARVVDVLVEVLPENATVTGMAAAGDILTVMATVPTASETLVLATSNCTVGCGGMEPPLNRMVPLLPTATICVPVQIASVNDWAVPAVLAYQ